MNERAFCLRPHDYGPGTYEAWHDWARQMGETHDQLQCPDCHLWVIWVPEADATQADVEQTDLFGGAP